MIGLVRLLALAEMARTDKSLLPNHLGTVDRLLGQKLADNQELINLLEPNECEEHAAELLTGLRAESERIRYALGVYAPFDGQLPATKTEFEQEELR
ncbi:hypothetical protein Y695_00196 [Hydrogenophaga sp. T4]|jgi:hypothetical protein|nr:hypothetical protein Y695_00196 [Hydrogenophaga sp. T4]